MQYEMPKQRPTAPSGFLSVHEAARLTGKSISMLCRAARQGHVNGIKGNGKTAPWFLEFESLQRAYPQEVHGRKRTKWNYVRPGMPVTSLYESNPEADADRAQREEHLRQMREAIDASG